MTTADKILARMRNNPRDWSIEDLKAISFPGLAPLTVPAHNPIKPIYVTRFVALIEARGGHDED